jgi:hypothetical protein
MYYTDCARRILRPQEVEDGLLMKSLSQDMTTLWLGVNANRFRVL